MVPKGSDAAAALILDTSAIISLILAEPGHEVLLDRISNACNVGIGAPPFVEAAMVLSSKLGQNARFLLNGFLRRAEAEFIPFSQEHPEIALEAFLRFGKGRHAAALNYGDCLAYAVASVAGAGLLYTGNDFLKTDIIAA